MERIDLKNRLINFSVLIIKIVNELPSTYAGKTLAGQIVRSGTSVALNYGEILSAESKKDLLHKMRVVLKELRETIINLKIIHLSKLLNSEELLLKVKKENNELISIFVSSIKTAQKNLNK
jgi:four helix bundle protein